MRKYSEKFLDKFSRLKNAIIGLEFEFYMKDLSFYKTMEMLNTELNPVRVHGFRQYHSDFRPDKNNFKFEPDLSGGSNMVELVTGPLEYNDAKYYLIKILNFIQNYGYTNDRSSIHFNLSFNQSDKDLNDLNILKLILNTDEEEIYRFFPSRKNNIYAKSIKNIIPYKEYDFFNIPIDSVKNNLILPDNKYFGINFLHINNNKETQRLEYRYIGGKDYHLSSGNIIYFLDRFILDTYNSIDTGFDQNDSDKLENYLENNISKFKSFSKYDNFLVEDCIVNYITSTQKIEIVDATVKTLLSISNFEFVNCTILDGIYENCNFYGCEINDSQISKSRIDSSDINRSKVLSCRVENSVLSDCFFMNGFLNSDMKGGIYRSGDLGPYATISPETKLVGTEDNFFNTKFDNEKDGDDKGVIKAFKK